MYKTKSLDGIPGSLKSWIKILTSKKNAVPNKKKLFGKINENSFYHKVIRKIFHRNIVFAIHEKNKLRNYFKKFKK